MFIKQLSFYTTSFIRFKQIKVSFFSRHLVYGLYFWSQHAVCLCNLLSSQQTTHIFVCMHRHDKYYLESHSSTHHFHRLLPIFFYTCNRDENFMLINLSAYLKLFKMLKKLWFHSQFHLSLIYFWTKYEYYLFTSVTSILHIFIYILFKQDKNIHIYFAEVFESLTCNAKKFSAS